MDRAPPAPLTPPQLMFIAPKIFRAAAQDEFVAHFCALGDRAAAAADTKAQQDALHGVGPRMRPRRLCTQILALFLLRRTKADVLQGQLPPKGEVVLYTGLTALQKKYYRAFLLRDHAVFGKSKARLLNTLMQARRRPVLRARSRRAAAQVRQPPLSV